MSIASLDRSFIAHPLTSTLKPKRKNTALHVRTLNVSCKHESSDEEKDCLMYKYGNQVAKLAVVTLAAGVLTLGSVDPASAAKSGGRVGGQAFKSSAPRASSPRTNNSRTNIYVNPPVAPPLVGGYGYGYGVPFYGGWGWSPFSFFAPGPSVAVGIGGGFDVLVLFFILSAVAAFLRRFNRSNDEDEY